MFELLFEMVCGDEYRVMVIYQEDGILYGVPCEEEMSGDYPVYEKRVQLTNCKVEFDKDDMDGIKVSKFKDTLSIKSSLDSHDGWQ